ncbi:MAG TPA: hypothetical protein VHG93_09305 [Longimicrobium sp.]|nr:hypothetical protein [Longimicrobium sp.]
MRVLLPILMILASCRPANPPREAHNPAQAPPVDSARVGDVRQVAGWAYQREVSADLDGDGRAERLVITSDVTIHTDGSPLWEDGHRWAVFARSPDGQRTMLYSAFVPNGFAEAAVLQPDGRGRRRVLVQERTPQQVRVLDIEYRAPHDARSTSSAYYQIERWLPGNASLR